MDSAPHSAQSSSSSGSGLSPLPPVLAGPLDVLARWERLLWSIVFATAIADIALTGYGLQLGLIEGNPFARAAIERYGVVGMVGLKTLSLGVGSAFWFVLPDRTAPIVPLGLAVPGAAAVCINVLVIAIVLV